jgi:hypothetical protein
MIIYGGTSGLPEQLIDITILISNLISQIPLVVLVLLILYYRLKEDIRNLKWSIDALVNFSESLLYTLYSKGIMSDSEYKSLQTLVDLSRPPIKTKYYTKEVYERLGELLKMDPDQYTWDHVFELERIAELIMKEAMESDRRDLAAYVGRLRAFIVLTQARLIKKGILPPRKEEKS